MREKKVQATRLIDATKVASVYSGRPGCACGCRGKHSYATAHREWAERNRGYTIGTDEVSDRSVRIITNKINKLGPIWEPGLKSGTELAYVETPTRLYIAYMVGADEIEKRIGPRKEVN